MSLGALRRISCSIIPSACGCKTGPTALFCSPALSSFSKRGVKQQAVAIRAFSTGPTPDKVKEPEQQLTFKDKVKNMWKNYGKLAIVTYIGVYASTLGSVFLALDFGAFNASTFGFDHAAAIAKVSVNCGCAAKVLLHFIDSLYILFALPTVLRHHRDRDRDHHPASLHERAPSR